MSILIVILFFQISYTLEPYGNKNGQKLKEMHALQKYSTFQQIEMPDKCSLFLRKRLHF